MAMIFGIDGVPSGPGCIQKDDGKYLWETTRVAEAAYNAGMQSVAHQMDRYKPDRNIANGHRTQLRGLIQSDMALWQIVCGLSDDQVDALIRASLKLAGDSPV